MTMAARSTAAGTRSASAAAMISTGAHSPGPPRPSPASVPASVPRAVPRRLSHWYSLGGSRWSPGVRAAPPSAGTAPECSFYPVPGWTLPRSSRPGGRHMDVIDPGDPRYDEARVLFNVETSTGGRP